MASQSPALAVNLDAAALADAAQRLRTALAAHTGAGTAIAYPTPLPLVELLTGSAGATATAIADSGAEVLALTLASATAAEASFELLASGLGDAADSALFQAFEAVGATGAFGSVHTIPAPPQLAELGLRQVVGLGVGNVEQADAEVQRRAAGNLARALRGAQTVVFPLPFATAEPATTGLVLGAYDYQGAKTSAPQPAQAPVAKVLLLAPNGDATLAQEQAAAVVQATAVAVARDLVNSASSDLFPASYANLVAAVASDLGLEVEVLDENQLREQGFGGIVGVGQGSTRQPRLVRLSYRPAGDATAKVALVGKGVTFDTGGISLKPGANMDAMISDMGGSAAVVGATFAAALLQLPVAVTATIPMAENMPDGNSYRPGDILTQFGGTTVEILNTDAEGRLILADAIARACVDQPDFLIETATLTGAQLVALGLRTAGVMGSEGFRDAVAAIGRQVGENAWAMPLPEEVAEKVKSPVADLRNVTNDRNGGMLAAGIFLGHFVTPGVDWVHIDVAGPAWNPAGTYGYVPARATGNPVRTIVATLAAIGAGELSKQA